MRTSEKERERIRSSIFQEISAGCERLRISRGEFARRARFAKTTLCARHNNPGDLRLNEIFEIANALNISVYTLLGIRDPALKNYIKADTEFN